MVDLDALLCNERWRCYKKRRVHSLISYWAEKFFLLPVSPLVWFGICCICNKKQKQKKKLQSTPELLYSIEIFFLFLFLKGTVWGVVGHEHQCAFFLCIFEKVLGREGLPQRVTHLSNLKNRDVQNLHE